MLQFYTKMNILIILSNIDKMDMFGCLAADGNKRLARPPVVNSTVSPKPKVNLTLRFAPNSPRSVYPVSGHSPLA